MTDVIAIGAPSAARRVVRRANSPAAASAAAGQEAAASRENRPPRRRPGVARGTACGADGAAGAALVEILVRE